MRRYGSAIAVSAVGLDAPVRKAQFRAQGGGVVIFRRWLWVGALMALLALTAAPVRAAVVVSSKLSSESVMIGQMIRLLLNAHGIPVSDRTALGATPVVRKALIAGEIDLYVEYTGNAGFFFNVGSDPAWKDLQRGYALGSRLDYTANRIVWLTPANASNSWALAVRGDVATANHLETMSDFARWVRAGGKVVLVCSAEFANAGTLASLERTYGFAMRPGRPDRPRPPPAAARATGCGRAWRRAPRRSGAAWR